MSDDEEYMQRQVVRYLRREGCSPTPCTLSTNPTE